MDVAWRESFASAKLGPELGAGGFGRTCGAVAMGVPTDAFRTIPVIGALPDLLEGPQRKTFPGASGNPITVDVQPDPAVKAIALADSGIALAPLMGALTRAPSIGPTRPTIHEGKQGKHIPGHKNFQEGKSELTHSEPQGLLDEGSGTGVRHGTKEVVDFGETIGTNVAPDGTRTPTSRGTIHYNGKNQAHIVPARPESAK